MADGRDEPIFEARNRGGLAVGGCLTAAMLSVFGGMPLILVAMTWQDLEEAPVGLPAFYVVSLLPLAILYVLRRLMMRHALRVRRDGQVELVLPFKTIRMGGEDLAAVRTSTVLAGTPGSAPMRRAYAHFISADGAVKASVAMSAFPPKQWQGFFSALSGVRPDIRIE
jgi:hypothetical protein